MIQILKDPNNLPTDYLQYIERKRIREVDLDANYNNRHSGRHLFENVLKKSTRRYRYESFKEKLLVDQGYVCCYCNGAVELLGSSVEHIVTIDSNKSLLAEYKNLLISCNGGREERSQNNEGDIEQYPLFCDAHRDNNDIPFSPLEIICQSAFSFSETGSITGINPEGQDMIRVLNLNCDKLIEMRSNAYSLIFDENNQIVTDQELDTIWDSLWEKDDDKYSDFFFPLLNVIYDII